MVCHDIMDIVVLLSGVSMVYHDTALFSGVIMIQLCLVARMLWFTIVL